METPTDSLLLRIYIGEGARHGHQPLHEAIVLKAREMHLAGATVLRGAMGFGKSSLLHTTKILRLSDDLPVVIEIVDSEEKVNAFMAVLGQMMPAGMATLDRVRVTHFHRDPPAA
jgi:PII-like signaling protein